MKLTIGFMIIIFGIFNTIVNSEMCEFRSIDEDIYNDILFDTHNGFGASFDNIAANIPNSMVNNPPDGMPE